MKIKSLLSLIAVVTAAKMSAFTYTATVGGGAESGKYYYNFDSLPVDSTASADLGKVAVSFLPPNASTKIGATKNVNAAPVLSGWNGVGFGAPDQANGIDKTVYLSTGPGGSIVFDLAGKFTYFGLLWGSVDAFNVLKFYNGATLVGTLTGADILTPADGSQGVSGTAYVNVYDLGGFTKVVATSGNFAFEIDNVAVPETSSAIALAGVALLGFAALRRRVA